MSINSLVVGGSFGLCEEGKSSKIANTLAVALGALCVNGGRVSRLNSLTLKDKNLVLWLANVANNIEKTYPKKDRGAVLICSKVMREGYSEVESLRRLFKMNANAVIEIYQVGTPTRLLFKLRDALNNIWVTTHSVSELAKRVMSFYKWTSISIREPSIQSKILVPVVNDELTYLTQLAKKAADRVEDSDVGRYFGNLSTRCKALFLTSRDTVGMYVSARNIPKKRLTPEDMVFVNYIKNTLYYVGSKKPSVDAVVQARLYCMFPNVNYMLHGHAYIDTPYETAAYRPCGDLREVYEVISLVSCTTSNVMLNLKNHGFLIMASTKEDLNHYVSSSTFKPHFGEIS